MVNGVLSRHAVRACVRTIIDEITPMSELLCIVLCCLPPAAKEGAATGSNDRHAVPTIQCKDLHCHETKSFLESVLIIILVNAADEM